MEVTPEYKIKLARELRQRQTESEARLWGLLRDNALDRLKFRRQRPIGRFVADFCCEEVKLVVEVDGGYHATAQQKELDRERAAHFTGRGYTVLRFSADAVVTDFRTVLRQISTTAAKLHQAKQPPCEAEVASDDRHPSPAAGEGKGVRA